MRRLDVVASSLAAVAIGVGAADPNPALGASGGAPYVPFPSSTSSGRAAPFIDTLNARTGLPLFDRLPSGRTGVVIQSRHGPRERLPAVPARQRRSNVVRRAGVNAGRHNSSVSAGAVLAAAIVLIALAGAAIGGRSRRGPRVQRADPTGRTPSPS
jgi:hypothetical protein